MGTAADWYEVVSVVRDMNRPLLIETAWERLQRLQALRVEEENRERHESLIAIQEERLRRLIAETRRN